MDLIITRQTLHRISDGLNVASWLSGQSVVKLELRKHDVSVSLKVSDAKSLLTMLTEVLDLIENHEYQQTDDEQSKR